MSKKILLIDDDEDDRLFFCEAMDEVAPEIVCYTAANGPKALNTLNNKEIEIPDLIFLDVNLPGISGWKCLSMLKEQDAYKHVPVIMYSTSALTEDVEKAQQLGALCFFTKPPDFNDLQKSLGIVADHLRSNSLSSVMQSSSLFIVPGVKR